MYSIQASPASLTKYGEEICGDALRLEWVPGGLVAVLADGMGNGIRANILATLTSRIIAGMLAKGEPLEDAVGIVVDTLPASPDQGEAYCTFAAVWLGEEGEGRLALFDSPPAILLRRGRLLEIPLEAHAIAGRRILRGGFQMRPGDLFTLFSDGAVHAGLSSALPWGWGWQGVADYLRSAYRPGLDAPAATKLLSAACESLYGGRPGDDVSLLNLSLARRT